MIKSQYLLWIYSALDFLILRIFYHPLINQGQIVGIFCGVVNLGSLALEVVLVEAVQLLR